MRRILILFLFVTLCLCACEEAQPTGAKPEGGAPPAAVETAPAPQPSYVPRNFDNVKAVWMSQWDLKRVYVTNGIQREQADFSAIARRMMQDAKSDGFNTVLVQVRPFGDSFFPSDYFPPSKMAVGAYGGEFVYDPIALLVEAAHEAGLSFHAWINPLRLMNGAEIEQVPQKYPVRAWYDDADKRGQYMVLQGDGRWYFNPGYAEVRDLIVAGARELMSKYDLDGLHLDDYFYPTTASDYDAQCFAQYTAAGGALTLSDFRRDCITQLVRELYRAVHEIREGALFGIAPGGNPDRAYSSQYADIYTWCASQDCVDYICPEIYFGFEHQSYPFDKTADKWAAMQKNDRVALWIGLSFHKAATGYDQYAGSGAYEWAQNSDILLRSLRYIAGMERVGGAAVFSYQHFRNAVTGEVPAYPQAERDAFLPLWKETVFLGSLRG